MISVISDTAGACCALRVHNNGRRRITVPGALISSQGYHPLEQKS